MNRFTLHAVSVAGTLIKGIVDQRVDPGIVARAMAADGMADPTYAAIETQDPTISFTTHALKTALDAIGISGLAISATPVILYFQKLGDLGIRADGATHFKLTIARGLLVPRTLQARRGGAPATIEYALTPVWNGTVDPIVAAVSQALAGTPGLDQAYTVGPVRINSASDALDNTQEITVDFGIQVSVGRKDGEVFPRDAAIMSRRPTIRVTSLDAEILSTFGPSGAKQGATDSEVWLQKIDRLGTRVAAATAEHIKIAVDDGIIAPLPVGSAQDGEAEGGVLITPVYDGTAAILAISTAAAITPA